MTGGIEMQTLEKCPVDKSPPPPLMIKIRLDAYVYRQQPKKMYN